MRAAIAGLGGAGGCIAAIAFFLPWITVSCNDAPIAEISAYTRAVGDHGGTSEDQADASRIVVEVDELLEPQPHLWSLLAIPLSCVALSGALSLPGVRRRRQIGVLLLSIASLGIMLVTVLWLHKMLGLVPESGASESAAPIFSISSDLRIGGWLSLSGHTLCAVCGVLNIILGQSVDST